MQLACGVLLIALAPLISNLLSNGERKPRAVSGRRRFPSARLPAGEAGG